MVFYEPFLKTCSSVIWYSGTGNSMHTVPDRPETRKHAAWFWPTDSPP